MMNLFKFLASAPVIVIFLLSNVGLSHAGPDITTNFFMNKNATLFDVGMVRLNAFLSEMPEREFGSNTPDADYKWDNDDIVITMYAFNQSDVATGKKTCRERFDLVQLYAGIVGDGEPSGSSSNFADFFGHDGFTTAEIQRSLPQLDKKFILRCFVYIDYSGTPNGQLNRRLLSKKDTYIVSE